MELRQLRTFSTVAQLLSFNRAAEQLNYAQSSVSAQIQSLEDELGVKLFDRLGRSILLTEAGSRLLPYANKMIDLADETLSDVASTQRPRGKLTIRVPETFAVYRLPKIIRRFHARFPDVKLEFSTCAHDGLEKDLRKGITDLAFLLTDSIQSKDLNVELLTTERLVMVAHPHHPLASSKKIPTSDLVQEPILLSKVDCSYRRLFNRIIADNGLSTGSIIEFTSIAAVKSCVVDGVGISILPEIAVSQELDAGKMASINWSEGVLEVGLLMIWSREKWLSPSLTTFMEMTRESMGFANLS